MTDLPLINVLLLDPVADQSARVADLLRQKDGFGEVWSLDWTRGTRPLVAPWTMHARSLKELHDSAVEYSLASTMETGLLQDLHSKCFTRFLLIAARARHTQRSTTLESLEAFRIHVGIFSRFISENNITVVVSTPPAYGFDYVCLETARAMNRTTLIVNELFFRRFIWSTSLEAFGQFEGLPRLFQREEVEAGEPDWRYFYLAE